MTKTQVVYCIVDGREVCGCGLSLDVAKDSTIRRLAGLFAGSMDPPENPKLYAEEFVRKALKLGHLRTAKVTVEVHPDNMSCVLGSLFGKEEVAPLFLRFPNGFGMS